jgi:hypothetical protein
MAPTAILLAALLLVPLRKWWIYLLAVIPVHVFLQLRMVCPVGHSQPAHRQFSQASLAAFSVRYFKRSAALHQLSGVLVFTLGAVIFNPWLFPVSPRTLCASGWEQRMVCVAARVLSNALSTLMIVINFVGCRWILKQKVSELALVGNRIVLGSV